MFCAHSHHKLMFKSEKGKPSMFARWWGGNGDIKASDDETKAQLFKSSSL